MAKPDERFDMTKATPTVNRFWRRVEKTKTCWNWTGALNPKGYGAIVNEAGTTLAVHRFAHELLIGPIPAGMVVDHACRNPACVNPAHLRTATNKQNLENLSGPYANNLTGFRGVTRNTYTGRYQARVRHNGKSHSAGYFDTAEEAAEAAAALRLRLFTHNELDRQSA